MQTFYNNCLHTDLIVNLFSGLDLYIAHIMLFLTQDSTL